MENTSKERFYRTWASRRNSYYNFITKLNSDTALSDAHARAVYWCKINRIAEVMDKILNSYCRITNEDFNNTFIEWTERYKREA